MALNDIERKRIEKTVSAFVEKRRPAPHIRPKLDFGFRVSGQSVELFEIRPQWDRPTVKRESSFAKATFVRTQGMWKVYLEACRPKVAQLRARTRSRGYRGISSHSAEGRVRMFLRVTQASASCSDVQLISANALVLNQLGDLGDFGFYLGRKFHRRTGSRLYSGV